MEEDSAVWDNAWSVHFEPIDSQHQDLVRMTRELFEACRQGGAVADQAFRKTIRDAVEYAQVHFYTEEKYMKQCGYPDLEEHKKEHLSFAATIVKTVKEFEAGKTAPIALARYMKQWLLSHIAESDRRYAPWLAKLQTRQEPPPP